MRGNVKGAAVFVLERSAKAPHHRQRASVHLGRRDLGSRGGGGFKHGEPLKGSGLISFVMAPVILILSKYKGLIPPIYFLIELTSQ